MGLLCKHRSKPELLSRMVIFPWHSLAFVAFALSHSVSGTYECLWWWTCSIRTLVLFDVFDENCSLAWNASLMWLFTSHRQWLDPRLLPPQMYTGILNYTSENSENGFTIPKQERLSSESSSQKFIFKFQRKITRLSVNFVFSFLGICQLIILKVYWVKESESHKSKSSFGSFEQENLKGWKLFMHAETYWH